VVRPKGQQFDLEVLSGHFTSNNLNVRQDEDHYYYLRSSDFGQLSHSSAVEERGRELLEYMNGAAKLLLSGTAGLRSATDAASRAQSRAELGDEARHASEKYKAPEDPMTLNEARAFVRSVLGPARCQGLLQPVPSHLALISLLYMAFSTTIRGEAVW
jgi:hypothetical protein